MTTRRSFLAVITGGVAALLAKIASKSEPPPSERGILWFLDQWHNQRFGPVAFKSTRDVDTKFGTITLTPHPLYDPRWCSTGWKESAAVVDLGKE